MKAAAAANRTKGIKSFLPSTSAPTSIDMKVAAAEGAFAYHIAKHAQSFKSTNCVSSDGLFKTIFPDSAIASLLFHDQFFEQCAEVTEALRRLQMKEPHVYDARIQRLSRGTLKAQENEYLPKEEWTKWEEREKAILPELLDEMQKFREKIRERARQKFYDVVTGTLLRRLSEEEAQVLEEQFQ
uniref:Cytochrome b-c1 complex subunit 7 n=1 Tax=Acrobeloides nanus TaxID=290746 RepID=A0A914CUW0_9BILA